MITNSDNHQQIITLAESNKSDWPNSSDQSWSWRFGSSRGRPRTMASVSRLAVAKYGHVEENSVAVFALEYGFQIGNDWVLEQGKEKCLTLV